VTGVIAARSGGSVISRLAIERCQRGELLVRIDGGDRFGTDAEARRILPPASLARLRSLQPRGGSARRTADNPRPEPVRRPCRDPVEVAADSDMVVARYPDDMLDMVGDVGRPARSSGRGLADSQPFSARLTSLAERIQRFEPRFLSRALAAQAQVSAFRKPGTKVTITTPPLAGSSASTSSGTLRGCGLSAKALEWEKMTGARLAAIASFIVAGRHVAEVDEHAEPVHFLHHLDTERAEAAVLGLVGRGVGPFGGLVVGQRHVANAEIVELAKRGHRAADLPPALDPSIEAIRPAGGSGRCRRRWTPAPGSAG
jgi:hypothetical protein